MEDGRAARSGAKVRRGVARCRFSRIGKEVHCLVPVPPSPYHVQNLESRGLKFRVCARSLSFKELHAKSREHES
jgi:hypothetical protein